MLLVRQALKPRMQGLAGWHDCTHPVTRSCLEFSVQQYGVFAGDDIELVMSAPGGWQDEVQQLLRGPLGWRVELALLHGVEIYSCRYTAALRLATQLVDAH